MSLPPLDKITGALLVATWASSLLYMAELVEAAYYFRHCENDDWKLKVLVAVSFTIDTISVLCEYISVYLYTIIHAGDPVYLTKQNWAMLLNIFFNVAIAILVQSFLVSRYWRLTHNIAFTVFLFVLVAGAFGTGFSSGITILLFPALKDRRKVVVSGTVAMIAHISADLLIAAALIREFLRMKSSFRHTQSRVLNRLVVMSLQTGSATAAIDVATVTTLLIDDETNIPAGIMYCIGRFYMLSMLLNLNIRTSARPDSTEGISSGLQTPGRPTSLAFAYDGTENLSGIRALPTSTPPPSSRSPAYCRSSYRYSPHSARANRQPEGPRLVGDIQKRYNENQRDMLELTFKSASGDDSFPEEIEIMSRKQSELVVP
ncbi:hypothetical protein K438DRAFT_1965258 [Mycena galopus ATCC 62051]|nr:hypothetical protein K438DRAFT_1965258 [Mycena galopus ATCC 62051]